MEALHKKTVTFNEDLNKESSVPKEQLSPQPEMKDDNSSNEDIDMALPDDKHGAMPPPATVIHNDEHSYSS